MARDDAETESLVPRSRDTWPMPRVSPTSDVRFSEPIDNIKTMFNFIVILDELAENALQNYSS